ncbi:23S rRNA (uracil(1939)-C(5))-methyltransferase RlmD [Gemella sp. zg-570]|uniref:23S rRNA (uracil(1939)-C(5))-methyltransferase RlmD n=1 Tax=Gemella sp. zg-570 TaxID=2840371 RepID=UPI001C0E2888|nr:23S rRNA (uracil(1939)-C(5))-methyltransferase RlmD [Gemella sp. zg-570]QWQ39375.1 23S rRNA (uracil(1939)-C(5))-methyltransferase RlmD [Gemella sp. zg-570]
MKKNDEFIAEVIDYTHDGLGVIKIDNFPLFVEDVIVGEKIRVKITKLKKNLGYARLIEIISSSPNRVEVEEKTSGANLMHMTYQEQLSFKTNKVKNIINKIVGANKIEVLSTLGMGKPTYYRNKSVVPVQVKNNEVKMGYYRPRSHDVINTNDCKIQYKEHNFLVNNIRKIISDMQLSIYDEEKHEGAIRHIMFRTNSSKTEIMVGIIAKEKFFNLDRFVEKIIELDKRIVSIMLNINSKKTNVILGEKSIKLYGKDFIEDDIKGIKFNISLASFYQVNPTQTKILYSKAIELANLKNTDVIIDAYCGIGTISLFAANMVKKVYGIEVVEEAVINAKENAKINNIKNVKFLLGKSEYKIRELIEKKIKIDAVIVDPPRKGCDESFLRNMADMNIPKIVYVSCNPASLARDLQIMIDLGYNVDKIQPIDMFPQTSEVEAVTLLTK